MVVSASLCIACKGRLWCKLGSCPIIEKFEAQTKHVSAIKKDSFAGSSPPALFVSWSNYPRVSIAPVSPVEFKKDADYLDNPERWFGTPENELISMRASLIRSTKPVDAGAPKNPDYSLQEMQELAMSRTPVNSEFHLKKAPSVRLSFNGTHAPFGPSGKLKKMSLLQNPKIPKKVEYFYSDTALKSGDAITALFEKHFPVHYLHKLLSAGVLGVKKDRRLVPTRWAITAVDSNVSQCLITEHIKYFQELSEYQVFQSHYLDNHFFVLLIPRHWSFEVLEAWLPGGGWASFAEKKEVTIIQDHELYHGRKTYANNVTGAYYAARLAVAEYLCKKKRQATAIIFREIGSNYTHPVGVWQIRENVRHALAKKPLAFSSLGLALDYIAEKTVVPFLQYSAVSKLLPEIKNQKRLKDWS